MGVGSGGGEEVEVRLWPAAAVASRPTSGHCKLKLNLATINIGHTFHQADLDTAVNFETRLGRDISYELQALGHVLVLSFQAPTLTSFKQACRRGVVSLATI